MARRTAVSVTDRSETGVTLASAALRTRNRPVDRSSRSSKLIVTGPVKT